jgi:dTDP-4-dehydrorhamnose 3,5-epimerase
VSVELSEENHRLLYVPKGFAQGFITLVDSTEVTYQVSQPYSPAHGRGVRYDDPAFGIPWPVPVSVISEKDRSWPDFEAALVAEAS